MSKFTTRHYVAIGDTLRGANASQEMVDAFVAMFRLDSSNFNEDMFRRYVSAEPPKLRARVK